VALTTLTTHQHCSLLKPLRWRASRGRLSKLRSGGRMTAADEADDVTADAMLSCCLPLTSTQGVEDQRGDRRSQ
jgi:hypothetical protein